MKIGIVGDVHWSKYSSIVRSRGEKYSTRLENCIQSINWAEQVFHDNQCDLIVYLGDFFDNNSLSAEELSALNDLKWNQIPHKFLVGNHEMGMNDLSISSSHVFNLCPNSEVMDTAKMEYSEGVCLQYLPYILEDNRESLEFYIRDKNCILFSHNDLKNVQMGKFISPFGFDLDEIEQNCLICFNGHLHNGSKVTEKIINVGNLTGQNFSEDALTYQHKIFVFDTDTMGCEEYINPHALNFVKLDMTSEQDVDSILSTVLDMPNVVCTLKLDSEESEKYLEELYTKAIAYRTIIQPTTKGVEGIQHTFESLSVNHLESFKEYILNELGNGESVVQELISVVG